MKVEHLGYFKDLLEGRATVSWVAWFRRNEAELSKEMPRPAFLRLKFKHIEEAEALLRKAGIEFTISPLSKREFLYANLHPSVLDEHGRPLESFRRTAYDGAFACFMDGDVIRGKKILGSFLNKLKQHSVQKYAQELADFCFDGEMEFLYGNELIGRAMLELLAEVDVGNDLMSASIFAARKVLKKATPT